MKKIIFLIIFMLFLSGCNTNYNSLNDLGIVSSLIIDKVDNDYVTYIEIYKEEKSENKSKKSSYFIKGKADTIKGAMNEASLTLSKDLYFSHINAVIFSKNAVDDNLDNLFNYLERRIDLNSNFYILVSDDIKSLMKAKDNDNPILGEKIKGIITYSTNNGSLIEYDFLEKLYNFVNPKIDVFLNKIEVKDDNTLIKNAYVFKENKIATTLNENEIKLTNLLKNKNNIYFTFNDKDEKHYFILKIDNSKTKYSFKDGISIDIEIKATLDAFGEDLDLKKESTINSLNDIASRHLSNSLKNLIIKLRNNKTDILGINNRIYKTYGNQKRDFFKDDIKIKVNVVTNKKGLVLNTLGGENGKKQ